MFPFKNEGFLLFKLVFLGKADFKLRRTFFPWFIEDESAFEEKIELVPFRVLKLTLNTSRSFSCKYFLNFHILYDNYFGQYFSFW